MSTWTAIAVATVALSWLGWKLVVTPWFPLEGAEKLFFVIFAWGMGATFLWASFSAVYKLPAAAIGLGLLLAGIWTTYGPIARWYRERPYWKAVEMASRRENERLEREAAIATERRKERAA